jgi:hypothetical protein
VSLFRASISGSNSILECLGDLPWRFRFSQELFEFAHRNLLLPGLREMHEPVFAHRCCITWLAV